MFTKGEVIELKNSSFRIVSIGKNEMRLKLLPKFDEPEEPYEAPQNTSVAGNNREPEK